MEYSGGFEKLGGSLGQQVVRRNTASPVKWLYWGLQSRPRGIAAIRAPDVRLLDSLPGVSQPEFSTIRRRFPSKAIWVGSARPLSPSGCSKLKPACCGCIATRAPGELPL